MANEKLSYDLRNLFKLTYKNNNIIFILLGCGGTGSFVADTISQLSLSFDNIKMCILVDGDNVEEKNVKRQRFFKTDIGKNKAEVLAKKYNMVSNATFIAYPYFVYEVQMDDTSKSIEELNEFIIYNTMNLIQEENMNTTFIVVNALDNVKSRIMMFKNFVNTPIYTYENLSRKLKFSGCEDIDRKIIKSYTIKNTNINILDYVLGLYKTLVLEKNNTYNFHYTSSILDSSVDILFIDIGNDYDTGQINVFIDSLKSKIVNANILQNYLLYNNYSVDEDSLAYKTSTDLNTNSKYLQDIIGYLVGGSTNINGGGILLENSDNKEMLHLFLGSYTPTTYKRDFMFINLAMPKYFKLFRSRMNKDNNYSSSLPKYTIDNDKFQYVLNQDINEARLSSLFTNGDVFLTYDKFLEAIPHIISKMLHCYANFFNLPIKNSSYIRTDILDVEDFVKKSMSQIITFYNQEDVKRNILQQWNTSDNYKITYSDLCINILMLYLIPINSRDVYDELVSEDSDSKDIWLTLKKLIELIYQTEIDLTNTTSKVILNKTSNTIVSNDDTETNIIKINDIFVLLHKHFLEYDSGLIKSWIKRNQLTITDNTTVCHDDNTIQSIYINRMMSDMFMMIYNMLAQNIDVKEISFNRGIMDKVLYKDIVKLRNNTSSILSKMEEV